jgi:hypothetical protein
VWQADHAFVPGIAILSIETPESGISGNDGHPVNVALSFRQQRLVKVEKVAITVPMFEYSLALLQNFAVHYPVNISSATLSR